MTTAIAQLIAFLILVAAVCGLGYGAFWTIRRAVESGTRRAAHKDGTHTPRT